jgi:hypothetical protein
MNRKILLFSAPFFLCSILMSSLECDCGCDSNLDPPTLQLEETPTTSIESVLNDIETVYPIVPDEGKEGGQVTIPQVSSTTSTSTTISPDTSTSTSTSTSSTTSITSSTTYTTSTTTSTSSTTSTTTTSTAVVIPVVTKLTFAHVKPGVYSEVYLDIEAAPGQAVTAALTGPGVISPSAMDGKTDSSGKLRLTWRINMYGTYSVQGMVDAEAFIKQIKVS